MKWSGEERRELLDSLRQMRDSVQGVGFQRLEPNRTDAHGGRDEDGQPLNEMNQAIASNRNRVAGESLERILEALETLEEHPDEYGVCVECEKRIPIGRLRLMPHAEHCVPCQSSLEGPVTGIRRRKITDHI